ncbi:transporter substrate-binding domain-containing diguanylate cyclase [Thiomicrorhabdus lithotrophica]|uniref:Diguanylate cyclase n=1 Tax=Thiomicrorhabdus lithotrophica TaxID=2949997 RepID=A0ABY8CCY2_9GAMM|nr:diguanylate cyclase [Thiomicrorhabdus lithotrophica]WEJ62401.1 diguanylate cyclase [Thiomicrorhabdus lithotrophica]
MNSSHFKLLQLFIALICGWFLFTSNSYASQISAPLSQSVSQSNQSLTPIKVQINWNHQYQFAGFYAAIKNGYYQQAGLDVSIRDWKPGVSVADEVVSGNADFGVGKGRMIVDYAQGKPLKLIMASFQFSPLVLLAHEPVNDLSEFSGKSVMYDGGFQIESLLSKANAEVSNSIKVLKATGNIQDFVDKEVDFYAAYGTNEPSRLKQKGVPFYILDPKTYGVQTYGDFLVTSKKMAELRPGLVKAFKDASIKGWQYAITHQEDTVDFIMQNYSVVKSRDDMLAEAKATTQYVKTGTVPIGSIHAAKLLASAATARELKMINQAELDNLNINDFIFDDSKSLFTPEELEYLKANPVIKLASDRNWAPLEFEDPKSGFSGISADYFKLFEKKLGVQFQPVYLDSWDNVLKEAKRGELDVFSCAVETPERSQYMRFTEPYLSFPMALASKDMISFADKYSQLEGYTIAVVKGYWTEELMATQYPGVKLLKVDGVNEGLSAVLDGRADGYLGNLAVINYTLHKYGLEGLRIVGQFSERFELAIGVQKDNPILFSVIQKTLKLISQEQRDEIFNRWVRFELVNKLNPKQLLQIFIPVFVIVLSLLLLLLVYAYQKRQQKAYINEIHELSFASEINVKTLKILWSSASFAKLSGYTQEEMVGMPYLNLSWKSLEDEQIHRIYKLLTSGHSWNGEMHAKTKAGGEYWVELTLTPNKNLFGKVTTVLATRTDITDKKRIELLSITDELTGLYNRRHYNEVIERELRRAKREHYSLSLAMLDIDFFKMVNDSYGHPFGDQVLKDIAKQLTLSFNRGNDFVFRVGGEEFIVISSFESESKFVEHLHCLLESVQGLQIENKKAPFKVITISIGGLYLEADKELTEEDILKYLDQELYLAKENGRNRLEMHSFSEE